MGILGRPYSMTRFILTAVTQPAAERAPTLCERIILL